MEKFTNVRKSDLSKESLESFPVWVWNDEQEDYSPLVGRGPLPLEFGTLFVRAIFTTNSGETISGYLVGLRSFYAFGLFVSGDHYVLNLNAPDLAITAIKAIGEKLKISKILPMSYVCNEFDGTPITGLVDI